MQDLPGDRGAMSGSQKKYTLEVRLGSTSSTPTATSWPAGWGTGSSLGRMVKHTHSHQMACNDRDRSTAAARQHLFSGQSPCQAGHHVARSGTCKSLQV